MLSPYTLIHTHTRAHTYTQTHDALSTPRNMHKVGFDFCSYASFSPSARLKHSSYTYIHIHIYIFIHVCYNPNLSNLSELYCAEFGIFLLLAFV